MRCLFQKCSLFPATKFNEQKQPFRKCDLLTLENTFLGSKGEMPGMNYRWLLKQNQKHLIFSLKINREIATYSRHSRLCKDKCGRESCFRVVEKQLFHWQNVLILLLPSSKTVRLYLKSNIFTNKQQIAVIINFVKTNIGKSAQKYCILDSNISTFLLQFKKYLYLELCIQISKLKLQEPFFRLYRCVLSLFPLSALFSPHEAFLLEF